MVSKIIICSSVRPWALIQPGIEEGRQSKIYCCVPHPLEHGFEGISQCLGNGCGTEVVGLHENLGLGGVDFLDDFVGGTTLGREAD
jgi:hypothetical protein